MKKTVLITTLAVLIVATGAYFYFAQENPSNQDSEEITEREGDINYGPPTPEEEQETKDFKEEQSNENDDRQENQSTDNNNVPVTLTRVSKGEDVITVTGYVDNDAAGKCKLTLTSSNATMTYTNPTETNPTNPNIVNCSTFRIPRDDLSDATEWVAQITYSTTDYRGTSQEWPFSL